VADRLALEKEPKEGVASMSKLQTMKQTKEIKQQAKEPESAFVDVADSFRQLLKTMRPYDVAWMASEVIGQLHKYTRDETLS
jgi:hypothetical protein